MPITREWSIEEQLIYCELALKDIALGKANLVLDFMRCSHFGVHNKILESWRVAFNFADIVVSNLDAKRTFTKIMDRADLPDGIYERAKNFKIRGSSGKVNIALSGMPKFTHVPDNRYINRGGQGFTPSLIHN